MPKRNSICEEFDRHLFRHHLSKAYSKDKDFARDMGLAVSTVSRWIVGSNKPTYKTLIKAAKLLDVRPHQLLIRSKRFILDEWYQHLIDYVLAPPDAKEKMRKETRIGESGEHVIDSKTTEKRETKLTERGALELSERLGIFDDDDDEDTQDENVSENPLHKIFRGKK